MAEPKLSHEDLPIEELLKLITKPGVLVVGAKGIESIGFEFDYSNELFDGCRMGQLLPLLFLKQQVDKKLVSYMASENPYGLEDNNFIMPIFRETLVEMVSKVSGVKSEDFEGYFKEDLDQYL